jgi:hypothetical protein
MSGYVKLYGHIAMLLLCASPGLVGCGRSTAHAGTSSPAIALRGAARYEPMRARPQARELPESALKARMPGAIMRLAADTIRLAPEPPAREPTSQYPSLDAACDSVESILRRAVAGVTRVTLAARQPTTFQYWYARAEASARSFEIEAADSCPNEAIEEGLRAAGWVESYGYGADGPDGSTLGFVSRDFLCLIEATWDGGDDSDTTYVPQPGCRVRITCVPRRVDDTPK